MFAWCRLPKHVSLTKDPAAATATKLLQSCPTLCDCMDCRLPGSCVHGIFHARKLEWAAISYSRGSSWPRDRTCVSCISCLLHGQEDSLSLCHLGSPKPVLWDFTLVNFILLLHLSLSSSVTRFLVSKGRVDGGIVISHNTHLQYPTLHTEQA